MQQYLWQSIMQTYDVDDGYVPSKAALEVMDWLDTNDRIMKAEGKMIDYFLEEIASHSPECECSKCLDYDEAQAASEEERTKYEPDFSNATSPTGEVD